MNGLNVGGGLGGGGTAAAKFVNGVPVVNTTVAGTPTNPAPLTLVGYSGATNQNFIAGADPDVASSGSTAQYFLPGFDVPGTGPNPYTGYPGYQGISKDKWYAFQNLPGFSDWQARGTHRRTRAGGHAHARSSLTQAHPCRVRPGR